MPRPDSQRIAARPTVKQATGPSVGYEVHANPLSQLVVPGQDHELNGLLSGLATINPRVAQFLDQKQEEDISAGSAARAKGQAADESQNAAWQRGYVRMDGTTKGLQDREGVREHYETKFNKDESSPEQLESFIAQTLQDRTKGSNDKDFIDGYNKAVTPELLKIRAEYFDHHRKAVVAKTEANGTFLLQTGFAEAAAKGVPVDDAFIESARKQLGTMGISGTRFNELMFSAAKRIGDEGNASIFDMFKRDRPDGQKGMYFIPAMKEKIDAAQIHAQNVFLANHSRAEATAKRVREDKQDVALLEVFLTEDPKTASALFDKHKQNGLFTRASEVTKYEALLSTHVKREARPAQEEQENTLMVGVYEGSVGVKEVLNADVTPGQKRRLLTQINQVKNEARQAAAANRAADAAGRAADAAARAAGKAVYTSPQYVSGKSYISGALASTPSPLDVMGVGTTFERQQRASALLEFAERVEGVKDPAEIQGIRENIVQRKLKERATATDADKNRVNAGLTRYRSIKDVSEAHRTGGVSGDDALLYARMFKERANQTK